MAFAKVGDDRQQTGVFATARYLAVLLCVLALSFLAVPASAQVIETNNILTKHRAQNLTNGGGANEDTINFTFDPGPGNERAVVVIVYHEYFLNTVVELNEIALNGRTGRIIGRATNSVTTLSKANKMTVAVFQESDLPATGSVTIQLRYGSNGFSSSNANGMGAAVSFTSFRNVDQGGIPTSASFNTGCIGSGTPPGGTAGGNLQLPTVTAPSGSSVIAGIGVGTNDATPFTYPTNPFLIATDDDITTGPGFAFGRILYFNNTRSDATLGDRVGISSGCNHRPITTELVLTSATEADLSVAKTNGTSEVFSGSTTTYTITVSHNGGDDIEGAIVTDAPNAQLSCDPNDLVSIAGDGVPPGTFTIGNLTGSGIALGTLSTGQSTTLTYSCQVN
ncbi:DUF11 domain-containing protein [Aurantiacibacter sediminis]|uniref:DUF11 domain-containing protein n=1 Tax=Aurantiacibacter sediminis TaxID=2793064 RepID=A0ABS0N1W2_9SPHN|nr:DUF11 domain-containing protein [Aurantiacibacter sediminis]MBH5321950.1 DUF11 domain-containing protein [Aurantiacibacter sediminis]